MLVSTLSVPSLALLSLQPHLTFALDLGQSPLVSDFPTKHDKTEYYARGGNDLVHQTWNILRDLEPVAKHSLVVAGSQPTGAIGSIWYYSKILFKTLFMNSPTRADGDLTKLTPELRNCVETLEIGAQYHDQDAIFLLAEMNFYGNFTHPRNFGESFRKYDQLAALDGNATAHHMLGLMYATGIGAPERSQAKALLHYTFAAEQGDIKSEMTLAFRYHQGIGTARDCNQAAEYYKRVADKAMDWWQSGPPGGHSIQKNAVRWVEFEGGAYGEGASFSSSGLYAPRDGAITTTFEDMLVWLDLQDRRGDYSSMLALGTHYYEPPRGYKKNFRRAYKQYNKIARAYWGKDGKVKARPPKGIEKSAGRAAAYIGRMFLRGEGTEQNLEKAVNWFRRGVALGDAFAQYHMGILYRDGLGVPKDGTKAAARLKEAAEQTLAIAQSAIGVLFLDQGDVDIAGRYFELAALSNVMEGFYYLAELTNKGVGRDRNCGLSVAYYKMVAEKAELLHSSFVEANSAFERGDLDRALIASLGAAEQGYENAQANVAFLLDQKSSVISIPSVPLLANPLSATAAAGKKRSKLLSNPLLALTYYTRSAQQANIDSLLKMGDYYLTGIDRNSTTPVASNAKSTNAAAIDNFVYRDLDKASTCFTTAAESHQSAQALWNLGWMHENGIGPVEQDFHIAKRYYDLALEMNKEAYLPVKLALLKLRLRSWWNGISGGKIKPIGSDDEKDNRPKSFWEWLNRFLDAAEEMEAQEYAELARQTRGGDDDGLGEFAYSEPGRQGNGDNEYYYGDGAVADDYLGDIDDGLIESLVIIALAGALAMLVYARQQRQREARGRGGVAADRGGAGGVVDNSNGNNNAGPTVTPQQQQREQQQQQQQQQQQRERGEEAEDQHQHRPPHQEAQGNGQNRGFFPLPGDPQFANWVAGGIGH